MFEIKGAIRHEQGVRHYRYTIHLEQSLVELFKVYEEAGGAMNQAGALLARRVDRCLTTGSGPRQAAQSMLHALRRARELNEYLLSEPALRTIKLQLCEHILFERTPESRWAAIRELLREHIDTICGTPAAGLVTNAEHYKQAMSRKSSTLGRMLGMTALFNFDLAGEEPPPNLVIRFRRGGFPDHSWETRGGTPVEAHRTSTSGWSPEHALCRWEYLAADLAHTLFRRDPRPTSSRLTQSAEPPAGLERAPVRVYCRLEGGPPAGAGEPEAPRQLELLPAEPDALLPQLQRAIHRRLRVEGVRVLAALMARLDASAPGAPTTFALSEIAQAAHGALRGGRVRRARIQRVRAVLDALAGVACTRIYEQAEHRTVRTTGLLTVIGRSAQWPRTASEADERGEPGPPSGTPEDERVTVALDPMFYRADGSTLGSPYGALPDSVLGEVGRAHPLALPLFVHLRQAWRRTGGQALSTTAEQLFQDCGLWLRRESPYRPIERLKQALGHLREAGLIGDWRLTARVRAQPLRERYRIEPPAAPAGQTEVPPPRGTDWAPAQHRAG